jgi:protein phosphatase
VYRLRGTRLEQLTFDHSLVWELRAARKGATDSAALFIPKNIITRSLGPNPQVQIDLEGPLPVQVGDTYLLCSDGLSGQVKDDEIGKVLLALPPDEAVRALVDMANLRGGPDNITVIVVRVLGPQAAKKPGVSVPPAQHSSRRVVHPAVWSTFGVLALSSAVLVAMHLRIAALAALVGAVVAFVIAMLQKFGGGVTRGVQQPLGRGPYVTCDCAPEASFTARLAELDQQLRDAAASAHWTIDWETFCKHENAAAAAARADNHLEAVREYCRAISCMMEQLRHQPGSGRGTRF